MIRSQFSSFLPQGMRPDQGIPRVAVLLTDGYSNGRAVAGPASQLRNIGVNIFCIGVGSYVNPSELNTIASDPDITHVFRMNSFNDLAGWVDKLSAVSCDGKDRVNRHSPLTMPWSGCRSFDNNQRTEYLEYVKVN